MATSRANWLVGLGAVGVLIGGYMVAGMQTSKGGDKSMPEVMKRMRYYNEALGVDCNYCHVPERFELDTPRKRTAQWMQEKIVDDLVTREGQAPVDCHTCHGGRARFLPSSR